MIDRQKLRSAIADTRVGPDTDYVLPDNLRMALYPYFESTYRYLLAFHEDAGGEMQAPWADRHVEKALDAITDAAIETLEKEAGQSDENNEQD